MPVNHPSHLRPTKLVLVLADLAGYARAFRDHADEAMAAFIDRFYGVCIGLVEAHHGRVVKFIGDACHAVFPGDRGPDAVAAMLALRREVATLGVEHGLNVDLGASIHCAVVMEGEYGPAGRSQYDVIGVGMNHTALMGRGAGIRLSEPVYRQLPSAARTPWQPVKPPALYHYREPAPAGPFG